MFTADQLIRLPDGDGFVKVVMAQSTTDGGQQIVVDTGTGLRSVTLTAAEAESVMTLASDGEGSSEHVLAAIWAEWMAAAAANTEGAAMISSQLAPYPHQHQAVYGAMIPQQPMLRFMLGDEPGPDAGLAVRSHRCMQVEFADAGIPSSR